MNRHPKFHYAPILPVGQIKPAPTRKQVAEIVIGWVISMAIALFLASPYGRLVFEVIWSMK